MSAITESLLEYLGEEERAPLPIANPATVLLQGERAQAWLLEKYLHAWLGIIGGLPTAGYPRAKSLGVAMRLNSLGSEAAELHRPRSRLDTLFMLEGLLVVLRSVCASVNRPDERSMQWGIWARDVPMSVAYGFTESEILDPVICEGVATCCMYSAYLVSMVVADEGVAEEVADRMFERLPRELLGLLRDTPAAPEA